MERGKSQEGSNQGAAENHEKRAEQECLTEQKSWMDKIDLMRMSEDDSTVERKHGEEERYWLQKEQDEASAHQDGKDIPQLQQQWLDSCILFMNY